MRLGSSRRELLKTAAGAAFAGRGANHHVGLAFIGVGKMGSANIRWAAKVPGFRIAAVCDVAPGVGSPPDCRDLLADRSIDAVCISAPAHWRARIAVEACQAGKDVYVEAPAFVHLEDGPRIVAAAREHERVVQAGTVLRSSRHFQKARALVASGALGNIAFCRTVQADPWNLHLIDAVRYLFDDAMPVSISAQSGNFASATLRYPSFIASHERGPANSCAISIHGDAATLVVHPEEDPHVLHWRNFLESIRSRARPAADIETCVRSTAVYIRTGLALRRNTTLEARWKLEARC